MAIIGIQIDKHNPPFTKCDFLFWMPQFQKYIETEEGKKGFKKIYELVNHKIFKSIFGSDWELAMSYGIAHYFTLIGNNMSAPAGDSLNEISGGSTSGVLSSMSVGAFSKSYDIDKTMLSENEAMFWNQTKYGTALMTLLKTKAVPSIFVVTSNPIGGSL